MMCIRSFFSGTIQRWVERTVIQLFFPRSPLGGEVSDTYQNLAARSTRICAWLHSRMVGKKGNASMNAKTDDKTSKLENVTPGPKPSDDSSEYVSVTDVKTEDVLRSSDGRAEAVVNEGDKLIDDEVRKVKPLFSIQDLVDALSIIISSGQTVSALANLELMEVSNMQIEKPAEVDVIPSELGFEFDDQGEWCLAIARQRSLKEKESELSSYPGFIKGLHHLIEGTTKEFYRIM